VLVTVRESALWWPLVAATSLTLAALAVMILEAPAPALLAVLGVVSRSIDSLAANVRLVHDDVMRELERLRLLGLSLPTASNYLAERIGMNPDVVALAHFTWKLERHGVDDQPVEVRELH
jgi:hypothetical protein